MLPILDAAQMRAVDQATVRREPIASLDLMERAGTRLAARILHLHRNGRWGDPRSVTYRVVAGMGNNGGDGLVIARLLHAAGIPVSVDRIIHRTDPSSDHASMLIRAVEAGVEVHDVADGQAWTPAPDEVIIDALFGTGLDRPLDGMVAGIISTINSSHAPVIAVDMPSGLFAGDNRDNDMDRVVRAALTLGIELPKLPFFLAEHAVHVGTWELVPIGLDKMAMKEEAGNYWTLEEADIAALIPPRPRFSHKGTFGHAMLLAGSRGMFGAAVLSTLAALRSGAGLVTARVPSEALNVMQTAATEAMCALDPCADHLSEIPSLKGITAIGIGPGMGMHEDGAPVLKGLIQMQGTPLVIDADALNILAENRTWMAFLPKGTILTPHPGEFDRLFGERADSGMERLERAKGMAVRNGVVLVLKGAYTAICAPDGKVCFSTTGNPGMAKGGTGDALTGLITGIRAQGLSALSAALVGVWVHGHAGDLASLRRGMDGMTTSDLVEAIPEVWKHLRGASEQSFQ